MNLQMTSFSSTKILVVGDVMLDRYWHGNTSRISPEAPVPVVHVKDVDERPGGAGNVALNIAAMHGQVSLMGLVGNDNSADVIEQKLKEAGVSCYLTRLNNIPTITKLRVMGRNQQLVRLDFEESVNVSECDPLVADFKNHIKNVDVVVLSDYNKGSLSKVQELISIAKQAGVPVLVDPKRNDFHAYRGAMIVTPNFGEFQQIVGLCHTEKEIEEKGQALIKANDLMALLVTRGAEGMTLLEKDKPALHLPTRAREVYDVTGAGDTVISVLALGVGCGMSMADSAALSNIAAGVSVRKMGAATVSIPELRRAVQRLYDSELGVLDEESLMIAVEDARAHNEKIVMTNGCFDILHAGHIHYLNQAKSLGKRLIVAVNDDASVARLKGQGRPINTLANRMAVLAGLRAVDWVVS
ncbi:MAG TPA: bifunctional D-glycero-beta-D-manno-heptose-7-phosphate kinase/D-glycero-beta-D-manno-heptose 1-phosphate adenylyltransferase HldE, partial [Paenisporosarcina sp.]|nr:bifunctional D-glycero-beta-D-manno-heptose-7-phosphate kinase/D-glycero-beta-D-manno-heptose 1-phosphate adenylyltransferase HldE [Paenisporosarcina sp.]